MFTSLSSTTSIFFPVNALCLAKTAGAKTVSDIFLKSIIKENKVPLPSVLSTLISEL